MMSKNIISDLLQIFRSSVIAVYPENLIRNVVNYNKTKQEIFLLNEKFNIRDKNVYIVGTGKAVQNMAREMEHLLGSKIIKGIISIPIGSLNKRISNNVYYYEGAKNNLPDAKAEETAKKIKDLVTKLDNNDMLFVLISGGGSALLPLPKSPITLAEKTELIKKLANSGADITELNTVRKRISELKGGRLAILAQPAKVVSLILSDIVGDPLDLIASGPTIENEDELSKALDILKKYNLLQDIPKSVKTVLQEGSKDKSFPKDNVTNHIIGSNKLSSSAAILEANNLNYRTIQLTNTVTGNVKTIAKEYSKLVNVICTFVESKINIEELRMKISNLSIPGLNAGALNSLVDFKSDNLCLVLGGEITVEVKGTGKGGRNQHLALEFSYLMHEMKSDLKNFDVYFLSAGTDGIDGPTDAAGAISYLDLVSDCTKENIDPKVYLDNNDSYNFYKLFKNGKLHVVTGHTNTNVMDIHLIVIRKIKYSRL